MFDTHAHLLSFDCKEEIINNMKDDGLEYIVNIATTVEDSTLGLELAEQHENVYTTIGIYPEKTQNVTENDIKTLKNLAKHKKVVAIGEIGLDYHSDSYDKETQEKVFVQMLEIADEAGLPFCVHCRGAVKDVFEILNENKNLIKHSGLMHCYSEGASWYKKFLDLGLYLSFSGNITYKKSDRSFLKDIPLDKILVETDAPYLPPEPFRGKTNYPKYVRYTIERLAKELGISFEELEEITTKNAKKFYFGQKIK